MTAYQNIAGGVLLVTNAGAPTSGTSGTGANIAGPGSLLIDTTNTNLYQNTNTKASPTWTQFSDLSGSLAFTDLDAGANGTAGSIDVFPTTATSGKVAITATDNSGDYTVGITNASHGQASTYSIPDSGAAAANIVVTTGTNTCTVATGAADRTVTLGGDLTTGGAVSLGGALTTGAALTFSGAFAAQITVPSASTWVLPSGGGTLATTTGAETGTTSATYTVDSDSAAAKIALDTNSATGDFTASLVPANLTADRTITFADASGTVMVLDNGGSQTAAGDFVWTGTQDFQGNITASAGNPAVDLSGSSGAFTTSTGTNTLAGNVVNTGNITFSFASSSGTFQTSTGTNTLNGNVVIAGSKTFTTGTGTVTINGTQSIAANKDIACVAGTTAVDYSLGTGIFKSTTGANTLSGDVTIAGSKTFTTGTGTVTVNGAVSVSADVNLACVAGTTAVDWSLGTGIFKTTTGQNTLSGDVSVAANKDIVFAAGTGYLEINGATSGGIKLLPIAIGTGTTTLQNSASAAATITLPADTCTLPGLGLANVFSAAQSVTIDDASNNAVTDLLTLTHTTNGATAAGIGVGISFCLEDAGGSEEQASIDAVMATVTDGAEDCDLVFKTQLNGDVCQVFKIDSVNQTAVIGQNASDADGVYKLTIYPVTASRGSLVLSSVASAGDTVTEITNASQAGARVYTIPDAGASAEFVMSAGASTISGAKAFTGSTITGVAVTKIVPFIENATNTVHTGTVPIPAGAMVLSIKVVNTVLWGAASAALIVGDDDDPNGYFDAVDCKATDLVVGEVLDTADDGCWGGKEGVYLTSAGRRGGVDTGNSGPYYAAGNNIIGVMTVGTPGATTGRTFMSVTYCVPESIAAVATGP